MKKLQWNMEEVFYFPESVGVPKDTRLVKVKAGFTEKRSEEAVRLSGIYHIAAKVDFGEGQRSESIPIDSVFVDDVEMEGEIGYFEYAVPLYIDLPPEVGHPLHIEATDVKSTFDGQGSFTVAWNVNCMYGPASADETASNETAKQETVSEETVSKEIANKEIANKEIVSKETASKETASNESASKETASKETASNESASKEKASKETASKETASNESASKETASKETASNESASKEIASNESASKKTSNNETVSSEPVSDEIANLVVEKETEIIEEKMTAAVQDVSNEKVVTRKQEPEQIVQVSEPRESSFAKKRAAAAPVQEQQATAMHDSRLGNSQDDILSYIAELPDEWTISRFRSNDIFVKKES